MCCQIIKVMEEELLVDQEEICGAKGWQLLDLAAILKLLNSDCMGTANITKH